MNDKKVNEFYRKAMVEVDQNIGRLERKLERDTKIAKIGIPLCVVAVVILLVMFG
jgi:hypothetical protein